MHKLCVRFLAPRARRQAMNKAALWRRVQRREAGTLSGYGSFCLSPSYEVEPRSDCGVILCKVLSEFNPTEQSWSTGSSEIMHSERSRNSTGCVALVLHVLVPFAVCQGQSGTQTLLQRSSDLTQVRVAAAASRTRHDTPTAAVSIAKTSAYLPAGRRAHLSPRT